MGFIRKFGHRATKLHKEIYKRAPRHEWEGRDYVHVYPYGVLEQTYRMLIDAGEQPGEPHVYKPRGMQALRKETSKPRKRRSDPNNPFTNYWERIEEIVKRKFKERAAKAARRADAGDKG